MKHIGSTIGIIMGVSLMLTGLTRTESFQSLITGIVVLFGSIAYRSAKKRKLFEVPNTPVRILYEILMVIVSISLVAMQNNLPYLIESDPVPNFLVPLWVIIAYAVIFIRKPTTTGKTEETEETD